MKCKWCGQPTKMTGTKMCDRCYELEKRVTADPQIAAKILVAISSDVFLLSLACSKIRDFDIRRDLHNIMGRLQ